MLNSIGSASSGSLSQLRQQGDFCGIANLDKALGQGVLQEAAHELLSCQSAGFGLAGVGGPVAESGSDPSGCG